MATVHDISVLIAMSASGLVPDSRCITQKYVYCNSLLHCLTFPSTVYGQYTHYSLAEGVGGDKISKQINYSLLELD